MNFVAGRVSKQGEQSRLVLEAGHERAIGTDQPLPDGYSVTAGIRPEAIHLSLEGDGDIEADVENFEQLGAVTCIYKQLNTGEKVTVQLPQQVELKRGQKIHITFPKDSIHHHENEEKTPFS